MKFVLAILLLVLILLQVRLWTGAGSLAELSRLEDKISEQTGENATLEARNSALMEEVGDLRNGLDSIEERARSELGLIRQGETFYLIVEDDERTPQQAETQMAPAELAQEPAGLPEIVTEAVTPEPPPEIAEEDNPYLEIFRDGEETPDARTNGADEQTAQSGPAAGQ